MSAATDPSDDITDPNMPVIQPDQAPGCGSSSNPQASGAAADPEETVRLLQQQLLQERQKLADQRLLNERLLALNSFGHSLENTPDQELTARSMAKMLQETLGCQFVCIFRYLQAEQRYKVLSAAGPAAHFINSSYQPDLSSDVIRLAVHTGIILSNYYLDEPDEPLIIGGQPYHSVLAAPLFRRRGARGLILLADTAEQAFGPDEISYIETAGANLLYALDASHQNETLAEFTRMAVIQEPASLLEAAASNARRLLNANYAIAATFSQQEWLMRGSGQAPQLYLSLQNQASTFLAKAIKSPNTFRMLDVRQDARTMALHLDSPDLCSLLASPIRINGLTAGLLLAFGKQGGSGFSDMDVFLAERLSEHTGVTLEKCYVNQKLRANELELNAKLETTRLLFDLSKSINQAQRLSDAARAIALTAFRLMQASECGLRLLSQDGQQTIAEVCFPADSPTDARPDSLIQQAVNSRQTIYLAENENMLKCAIPIQTLQRCYGALWMEFTEESEENSHPANEIQILVNQAAVALERAILFEETRQQAGRIAHAYEDLLHVLTKALDTRDENTEEHSERVTRMAIKLGGEMGLTGKELQDLKLGSLLHDIGKIGIPDDVLLKKGRLDEREWEIMRQHPKKGADLIEQVDSLQPAYPVVLYHQERWDGSGYPEKKKGEDIPLLARIFAVVDVFDALTSTRPYRTAMSVDEALEYLEQQSGIHFDPDVVTSFVKMLRVGATPTDTKALGTGPLYQQVVKDVNITDEW